VIVIIQNPLIILTRLKKIKLNKIEKYKN